MKMVKGCFYVESISWEERFCISINYNPISIRWYSKSSWRKLIGSKYMKFNISLNWNNKNSCSWNIK